MFFFFKVGVLALVGQQSQLVLFSSVSLRGFHADGHGKLFTRVATFGKQRVAIGRRRTPCLYWITHIS